MGSVVAGVTVLAAAGSAPFVASPAPLCAEEELSSGAATEGTALASGAGGGAVEVASNASVAVSVATGDARAGSVEVGAAVESEAGASEASGAVATGAGAAADVVLVDLLDPKLNALKRLLLFLGASLTAAAFVEGGTFEGASTGRGASIVGTSAAAIGVDSGGATGGTEGA